MPMFIPIILIGIILLTLVAVPSTKVPKKKAAPLYLDADYEIIHDDEPSAKAIAAWQKTNIKGAEKEEEQL